MESIRAYLLSIIAAAIVCGIITVLLGSKGTHGAMAKLMAGLFLAFTVIRPVAQIDFTGITDFAEQYTDAGTAAAEKGKILTREALTESIKRKTEAYILDKAEAMRVTLSVEVELSEHDVPVPVAVQLEGAVSPYAKQQLQRIITEDLGIDKEHQTWT